MFTAERPDARDLGVLSVTVEGDLVAIEACPWQQLPSQREVTRYQVLVEDGAPIAVSAGTVVDGDCDNGAFISSLTTFLDEWESTHNAVLENPDLPDPPFEQWVHADLARGYRGALQELRANGQQARLGPALTGGASEQTVHINRELIANPLVKVARCVQQRDDYGIWQGDTAIDVPQARPELAGNEEELLLYALREGQGSWIVLAEEDRLFVNCGALSIGEVLVSWLPSLPLDPRPADS